MTSENIDRLGFLREWDGMGRVFKKAGSSAIATNAIACQCCANEGNKIHESLQKHLLGPLSVSLSLLVISNSSANLLVWTNMFQGEN